MAGIIQAIKRVLRKGGGEAEATFGAGDLAGASDVQLVAIHKRCHDYFAGEVLLVPEGETLHLSNDPSPEATADAHAEVAAAMKARGMLHVEAAIDEVAKASYLDISSMVGQAVRDLYGDEAWMETLVEIPPTGVVIFEAKGQHYRADYDCSEGTCTLTNAVAVEQTWVAKSGAAGAGKPAEAPQPLEFPVTIRKAVAAAGAEQGKVYGIAAVADNEMIAKWAAAGQPQDDVPSVVDTQGEWMTEATVVDLAENHLAEATQHGLTIAKAADGKLRVEIGTPAQVAKAAGVGVQHQKLISAELVQSAIITKGTRWPTPEDAPLEVAVAWAYAIHTNDEEVRKAVREGKLGGLSIGGTGYRVES